MRPSATQRWWAGALARRLRGERAFEALALLRESERWSPARLREAQAARLEALLRHAWENVPYYRRILAEAGVVRGASRPRVDLARLPDVPLPDRATLRDRADELQDRRSPLPGARRAWARSGGTTGGIPSLSASPGRVRQRAESRGCAPTGVSRLNPMSAGQHHVKTQGA